MLGLIYYPIVWVGGMIMGLCIDKIKKRITFVCYNKTKAIMWHKDYHAQQNVVWQFLDWVIL